MNKDELIDEIVSESDKYIREELEDSSEFTNSDRRSILSDIREGKEPGDDKNPTAKEIAEENGYPKVEGKYVIGILDDGRGTDEMHHCRLEDGGTMHVRKDKFE